MSNSFIWPIDRTLSGATSLSLSRSGSNGNKGVLHIPQSSRITGASSLDLVSYPGHSLGGGSYPSAEMQSVCSSAPANWAIDLWRLNLTYCQLRLSEWKTTSLNWFEKHPLSTRDDILGGSYATRNNFSSKPETFSVLYQRMFLIRSWPMNLLWYWHIKKRVKDSCPPLYCKGLICRLNRSGGKSFLFDRTMFRKNALKKQLYQKM